MVLRHKFQIIIKIIIHNRADFPSQFLANDKTCTICRALNNKRDKHTRICGTLRKTLKKQSKFSKVAQLPTLLYRHNLGQLKQDTYMSAEQSR